MILVIDNYDSFVYNLVQYLGSLGEEIKVVRNNKITLSEIEKLNPLKIVISPGPGKPENAGISKDVVSYFSGKIPILGVCLGHQCIGEVFGANISQAKSIVHGKTSIITHSEGGIFRGIPPGILVTRYHSLVILKESIPKSLSITAVSEDGEIMAIKHKDYPTYGVQFHPESIASQYGKEILENFLKI
ncbi:GMP synthase (glutamine-hydrolyzing), N-terminal domain or A subunit [Desulfonispora thiosulfatigenes DSM 11270]|uniref:GMP synthase (Glutamine-hydrolyzing), N-terminal domain or A subunit n=1 Tax=Desulfonispora thiosulfatigenes DSM 11270 TaxID=656914 RepID=A0A1W1VA76_DESTI|nr:aminodeoxychorismate/anthranilate synthase component II [Desulfonispora thiosulfatigenes]SMB90387.1 GMP synthase (glutamine-hydrolyzing), N-terminal domain or A subunit [Desulfonispora thiosulfatigenes DSM 11270]